MTKVSDSKRCAEHFSNKTRSYDDSIEFPEYLGPPYTGICWCGIGEGQRCYTRKQLIKNFGLEGNVLSNITLKYPGLDKSLYREWMHTLTDDDDLCPSATHFYARVHGLEYGMCKYFWFKRWPTEEEAISMVYSFRESEFFMFGFGIRHGHGN